MSDDEKDVDTPKLDDGVNTNRLVNAVASRVPIPTLKRDQVDTWFLQLEQWFLINRISEKMKFGTVVASLDPNIVSQVYEAVKHPPDAKPYDNLKQAVLAAYAETSQQRFQKLVSGIQLGDRRPSHLLNELRQVSDTKDENILKNFWLSRLPIQVKVIVSASKGELSEVAKVADAVMDAMNLSVNQLSQQPINQPPQASCVQPQYDQCQIQRQLQELTLQVQQLSVDRSSPFSGRFRSKSPAHSWSHGQNGAPSNCSNQTTTCWYHRTYGTSANKCRQPCDFAQPSKPSPHKP